MHHFMGFRHHCLATVTTNLKVNNIAKNLNMACHALMLSLLYMDSVLDVLGDYVCVS